MRSISGFNGSSTGGSFGAGQPVYASALNKLATSRTLANVAYGPTRPEQGLESPLLRVEVDQPAEGTNEAHIVLQVGETATHNGQTGRYARRAGVDATALLPGNVAQLLLDLAERPDQAAVPAPAAAEPEPANEPDGGA